MTLNLAQRTFYFMGQAWALGLINPIFQLGPSIRKSATFLPADPSCFTDIIVSATKQPSFQGRNGNPYNPSNP